MLSKSQAYYCFNSKRDYFNVMQHDTKCLKVKCETFCSKNYKMTMAIHFYFLIQFNVPFKIISLIETSQSIGGAKREYPGKTT